MKKLCIFVLLLTSVVCLFSQSEDGQIVKETEPGLYEVKMTKSDGIYKGQIFNIMSVNEYGAAKNDGWGRLNSDTQFTQIAGNPALPGMFLEDARVIGLDLRVKVGMGINTREEIKERPLLVLVRLIEVKNDYGYPIPVEFNPKGSPIFFSGEVMYDLAPLVKLSQFFLEAEFSYATQAVDMFIDHGGSKEYERAPGNVDRNILGFYGGVGKKWWNKRHGLHLNAKAGFISDRLKGNYVPHYVNEANEVDAEVYSGMGCKAGAEYIFLISQKLQFNIGGEVLIQDEMIPIFGAGISWTF
jgi:hypothetical protein